MSGETEARRRNQELVASHTGAKAGGLLGWSTRVTWEEKMKMEMMRREKKRQ